MLRRDLLLGAFALPLTSMLGAGDAEAFIRPSRTQLNGPVDGILVKKSERKMYLVSGKNVVREYRVNLGFNPVGHKQFKGDGRTPEGNYSITHKNPQSRFHLSLGVSYPSRQDRLFAARHGRSPGGDIYIHGTGRGAGRATHDWTRGCIAVTDAEMDEIFKLVRPGTRITIAA